MFGAAAATLISYAALAVIHTAVVRRWKYGKYPLRYSPVMLGLAAVIAACAGYDVLSGWWPVRWGIAFSLSVYLVMQVRKRKAVF